MEAKLFIYVKCSSYDPENGFREWFEIQPQYDESEIIINLESMTNES